MKKIIKRSFIALFIILLIAIYIFYSLVKAMYCGTPREYTFEKIYDLEEKAFDGNSTATSSLIGYHLFQHKSKARYWSKISDEIYKKRELKKELNKSIQSKDKNLTIYKAYTEGK